MKTSKLKRLIKIKSKRKRILLVASLLSLFYWWFFSLPTELFNNPTSTALYSQEDRLLGATIADDGQWRFPLQQELPEKFTQSLISFEDERFFYHPGIDIFSIGRAMVSNIKEKRIVSGASTISMQVIRLHRVDKPRVWKEKIIEMLLAIRLECRYSKKEILALWAAHAPFGGNVVGLEAAAWRYYGRQPELLSWGEASTLAVLPNAPTIIHPGKNRDALLRKRNRLLKKLVKDGVIDQTTAELASLEPLPDKPKPMPQFAPHLLTRALLNGKKGQRIQSTVQFDKQQVISDIVDRHHQKLKQNEIHNAAVLVLDVKTNEVVAYIGNTNAGKDHGQDVDIADAPRSSGSILKPFLFAAMNQEGSLLPQQFVSDIPTQVAGYRPKNFYDQYDGAVPADEALCRSLNIPAVRMLQTYGVEKFQQKLKELNFSTITKAADHYGLSLILGGAEVNLFDLTQAYGAMANQLNTFHSEEKPSNQGIRVFENEDAPNSKNKQPLDAGSIYLTFEALTSVKRPASQLGWDQFRGARKVAWKTGTSIGFRDAWSIGVTPEYVVAVWVGNADGEGRPELVGTRAAAPILFDVFDILPRTTWFERPHDKLRRVQTCAVSGFLAHKNCPKIETRSIHKNGRRASQCKFHKKIFTDESESYIVNASCYPRHLMKEKVAFELPPTMSHYYRAQHADYLDPLPHLPSCNENNSRESFDIVYPQPHARIKVPIELTGEEGKTIFEVAHADPSATVFWHVDDEFIGSTTSTHALAINPTPGQHRLKIVDNQGREMVRGFEVLR